MSSRAEDQEVDQFLNIARLGIDAEAFMSTPIGRFINGKAQAELDQAMNELVDADPDDAKANRDIRNRIHVVSMFLNWIGEAIAAGNEAHRNLKEAEDRARFPG